MVAAARQVQEGNNAGHAIADLHAERLGVERDHRIEPWRVQQDVTEAMRPRRVALGCAAPTSALIMTGRVDGEGGRGTPRFRTFRPHVDRMAVRILEPQAAAEGVMWRVDLLDAALLHARADGDDALIVAAEA